VNERAHCYRVQAGENIYIKPHNPTFISFDALPACDGQPVAMSRSSIAKRDKKIVYYYCKLRVNCNRAEKMLFHCLVYKYCI